MLTIILLALGGALGTLARHGINVIVTRHGGGSPFPLGTLLVNVTGCFLVGFLGAVVQSIAPAPRKQIEEFLIVGFCGGYTTFSSYSLQTLTLASGNEWPAVAGNVIGSNVLGFVAVYLGWTCGKWLGRAS